MSPWLIVAVLMMMMMVVIIIILLFGLYLASLKTFWKALNASVGFFLERR